MGVRSLHCKGIKEDPVLIQYYTYHTLCKT